MSRPSDAGIFLWMTYQTMQKAGLDCAAIFASVNMPDAPPDPHYRRDNTFQRCFWEKAEQVSQDPDIGLHIGGLMPPFRGQIIEYLFLSSPTFGEGLQRTVNYYQILTDAMRFGFAQHDQQARITGLHHPVRHYLECAIAILLHFLRHVTDGDFQPIIIHLPHTQGANTAEYQRIYGCPVQLGMPDGAIVFDAALLTRPSMAAEPQLLAVHEHLAAQRLAELSQRHLIHQIEQQLGGLLEQGDVQLEHVATRLGKAPRQLRSELARINLTFTEVVARYRERLARRLLARTQEPIDQIIYLTGFSEPSAFTRAFKRWTGETPTTYRKRKQQDSI